MKLFKTKPAVKNFLIRNLADGRYFHSYDVLGPVFLGKDKAAKLNEADTHKYIDALRRAGCKVTFEII